MILRTILTSPGLQCLQSKIGISLLSAVFGWIICYIYFYTFYGRCLSMSIEEFQEVLFQNRAAASGCSEELKLQLTSRRVQCECTDQEGKLTNSKPIERPFDLKAVKNKLTISEDVTKLPNVVIRYANETLPRCPLIKGRRIVINYAAGCCHVSQPLNCDSAVTVGGFDMCIMFGAKSLDSDFIGRNKEIFEGEGVPPSRYWLWKPYILLKTLLSMRDDDVLFYADSGSQFVENFDLGPICLLAEKDQDIAVFSYECAEKQYSKADAFILMNCREEKCYNQMQLTASFLLFRKTLRSIQFVSQWLTYAQDYRILNDSTSQFVEKESMDFKGHRNDQTIVSILAKKWNIDHWPDPSQWSALNDYGRSQRVDPKFNNRLNKTFILHTRMKI